MQNSTEKRSRFVIKKSKSIVGAVLVSSALFFITPGIVNDTVSADQIDKTEVVEQDDDQKDVESEDAESESKSKDKDKETDNDGFFELDGTEGYGDSETGDNVNDTVDISENDNQQAQKAYSDTHTEDLNEYREANGKSALTQQSDLNAFAKHKIDNFAKDLPNLDSIREFRDNGGNPHQYNGRTVTQQYEDFHGYPPENPLGENLAYTTGYIQDKEAGELSNLSMEMWENSPGHNANMLNDGYGSVGNAYWTDENGTYYAVQIFESGERQVVEVAPPAPEDNVVVEEIEEPSQIPGLDDNEDNSGVISEEDLNNEVEVPAHEEEVVVEDVVVEDDNKDVVTPQPKPEPKPTPEVTPEPEANKPVEKPVEKPVKEPVVDKSDNTDKPVKEKADTPTPEKKEPVKETVNVEADTPVTEKESADKTPAKDTTKPVEKPDVADKAPSSESETKSGLKELPTLQAERGDLILYEEHDAANPDRNIKPVLPSDSDHFEVTDKSVMEYVSADDLNTFKEWQQLQLKSVNDLRAENGLNALEFSPHLSHFAHMRALDMWMNTYFGHDKPLDNGEILDLQAQYELMFGDDALNIPHSLGENLTMGYTSLTSDVLQQALAFENLTRSPEHYQNMLDERYTHAGFGMLRGEGKERWKVVQIFYIERNGAVTAFDAEGNQLSPDEYVPVDQPSVDTPVDESDNKSESESNTNTEPNKSDDQTPPSNTDNGNTVGDDNVPADAESDESNSENNENNTEQLVVDDVVESVDDAPSVEESEINIVATPANASVTNDNASIAESIDTVDMSAIAEPVSESATASEEDSTPDMIKQTAVSVSDDKSAKSSIESDDAQVSEESEQVLPNTGTTASPMTIIIGAVMALFASVSLIFFRRKKTESEEK